MKARADLAQALTAAISEALRLLRERAGYPTLRPAVQAIHKRTGYRIGRATLSAWERGTLPRFDLLLYFLVGLGYDLTHLQGTLEEVVRKEEDPSTALAICLREDPELRALFRGAILDSPAAPEGSKKVLLYLEQMNRAEDE